MFNRKGSGRTSPSCRSCGSSSLQIECLVARQVNANVDPCEGVLPSFDSVNIHRAVAYVGDLTAGHTRIASSRLRASAMLLKLQVLPFMCSDPLFQRASAGQRPTGSPGLNPTCSAREKNMPLSRGLKGREDVLGARPLCCDERRSHLRQRRSSCKEPADALMEPRMSERFDGVWEFSQRWGR
jgi:hypothetical protein